MSKGRVPEHILARARELAGTKVKKETEVVKKNNTNPYWDEEIVLDLKPPAEATHLDPITPAFDTLEFESCSLEVRCYDWDRIGR